MTGTPVTPRLALTLGDPAGIGPEIVLRVLEEWRRESVQTWTPVVVGEMRALETAAARLVARVAVTELGLEPIDATGDGSALSKCLGELSSDAIAVVDPVSTARKITLGRPGADDARAALAAIDCGLRLADEGAVDALVTAPVSKSQIARHVAPGFRGHTEYLADRLGGGVYGTDYLMSFVGPDLRVALLSTHVPLREALSLVQPGLVLASLRTLHRNVGGRLALAGLNPHAGEAGLLGAEDAEILEPAVTQACAEGLDVSGPESPDTVFQRARRGEFDWVLALYHDQGLIAVKTASFGETANWTLGLPILRTSVDHGTAFDLAGRGLADWRPLQAVVERTLTLIAEGHPRRRASSG